MDLELQVQRFEQQLSAFEKLHSEEMNEFKRKLQVFTQLHHDEIKLLQEELSRLKEAVRNQL